MQINWNFTSPRQQNNNFRFILVLFGIAVILLGWQNAITRILFQDSSFLFFRITNEEQMVADHYRYGALPFQFPGWLAIKIGASLEIVAYILTLSYIVIPLAVGFYIMKKSNMSAVPMTILTLFILTGPHLFYLGMLEIIPGFTYSLLFYYLISEKEKKINFFVQVLLGSTLLAGAISSHPSLVFLLGFLIVYQAIEEFNKIIYKKLIWLIPLSIVFWLKTKLIAGNAYEENFIRNIRFDALSEIGSYWSWGYFKHELTGIYLPLSIISIVTLVYYLVSRLYVKGILYLIGIVATAIILLMAYKDGDGEALMEKSFSLLIPMAFIPFAEDFLFKNNITTLAKHIFLIWAFVYCLTKTIKIGNDHRLSYQKMEQLMQRNDLKIHSKILIPVKMTQTPQWFANWALPYESLCYTAIKNNNNAQTLKQYSLLPDSIILNNSTLFIGPEFVPIINISTLNKKYYLLSNTKKYYIIK